MCAGGCIGGCTCSSNSTVLPTGSVGATGATGAKGEYGGFSSDWVFSTATGSGAAVTTLRLNNATPSLATKIYVSNVNADSSDLTAFLASLTNNSKYGYIRLFKETNNNLYVYAEITAVTNNVSEFELDITYIGSNSTFAAADPIVLSFSPAGPSSSNTLNNDTAAGNVTSGTGTDALKTYTVPANTLKTNEDVLEIDASYIMSGTGQNKNISFSLNGTNFITKLPSYPVANTIELPKGVKYAKVKFTITRVSTISLYIAMDVFLTDDVYYSVRGYHFDETMAIADVSTNTLVIACFGSNYDATSNTETITQNQLLVRYYNK